MSCSFHSKNLIAAAVGILLLATGCMVGPKYQKPDAATAPAAYAGATNEWKVAEPQGSTAKGNWWEVFNDPALNQIETELTVTNQELRAAYARFAQAREAVNIARSGYFPNIGVAASATRERDSANRNILGHAAGSQITYNNFTVPLEMNYEVDLWGRVRRSVASEKAGEQASADDVAAFTLALQSEAASDYFTLRELDAESALLNTNIEVFQKSLELTRNRRAGGIATDLDVAQSETVLKTTEAQLPATALQRIKLEHALAVLTGKPASTFSVTAQLLNLTPTAVPAGVPSALLERRPDIAAAERRMAAANEHIGVTRAAFFPTVTLNGLAGLQSVNAGTAFNWSSRMWSLGPSINLPIFEGGKLRATERQAKAAYDEMTANYQQTVLSAFAEVEDNLAAERLLTAQYDAEQEALKSARKTLDIANNRYRAGLVTYLEVATAQNDELGRERETVRLSAERLVAEVALIKSLGGGWVPKAQ